MKNQILILFLLAPALFLPFSCTPEDEGIPTIPAFEGGLIDANVGGDSQPNQVYIDLSKNSSTEFKRSDWDLGFSSDEDYRVVLNSSVGMMAYKLDKNNIDLVNAGDTVDLNQKLSLEAVFGALFGPQVPWLPEAKTWIDDPSRDLSFTAIDEVQEDASGNMVYIINRGNDTDKNPREWKKIQILRIGNGYELKYADIFDPNHQSIIIEKNSDFNFSFFHFENGLVEVEPKKSDWDIAFTTWTELTDFGTEPVPYFFMDYVITNPFGVFVAKVDVQNEAKILEEYEAFSSSDLAGLNFNDSVNFIGENWRTIATPTPGSVTGVKTDRFYVIKDARGNRYKLIFTALLNEQGERGHPQILFDLL